MPSVLLIIVTTVPQLYIQAKIQPDQVSRCWYLSSTNYCNKLRHLTAIDLVWEIVDMFLETNKLSTI